MNGRCLQARMAGLQALAYQPTVMVATVGLVPISEELKPRTSS